MKKYTLVIIIYFCCQCGALWAQNSAAARWYEKGAALWSSYYENKNKAVLEQSIKCLDKCLALDSTAALAYYPRGMAYYELGNFKQAEHDITRYIQKNVVPCEVYFYRADIYIELTRYDYALLDLSSIMQGGCQTDDIFYYMGMCHMELNNVDAAIVFYTKAIEVKPQDIYSYMGRAISFASKKEYERAEADINKTLEIDSTIASAYVWRGLIAKSKGNYEKAMEDYRKALNISTDAQYKGMAYACLADCYWAIGNRKKACEYWQVAVEVGYAFHPLWRIQFDLESPILNYRENCQ